MKNVNISRGENESYTVQWLADRECHNPHKTEVGYYDTSMEHISKLVSYRILGLLIKIHKSATNWLRLWTQRHIIQYSWN